MTYEDIKRWCHNEMRAPADSDMYLRAKTILVALESANAPTWLADAAEALGEVRRSDGAPLALTWTQIVASIYALRDERDEARAALARMTTIAVDLADCAEHQQGCPGGDECECWTTDAVRAFDAAMCSGSAASALAELRALRAVAEAARGAVDAMMCGDPSDPDGHDSHRCGRCDEDVDRNGVVRSALSAALSSLDAARRPPRPRRRTTMSDPYTATDATTRDDHVQLATRALDMLADSLSAGPITEASTRHLAYVRGAMSLLATAPPPPAPSAQPCLACAAAADLRALSADALRAWGREAQFRMIQEECAELIVAVSHWLRRSLAIQGVNPHEPLVEEAADVAIMLETVRGLWPVEFDEAKARKLARLRTRLPQETP